MVFPGGHLREMFSHHESPIIIVMIQAWSVFHLMVYLAQHQLILFTADAAADLAY
jgi:hypothetical protein